jgi:hypothetical protein
VHRALGRGEVVRVDNLDVAVQVEFDRKLLKPGFRRFIAAARVETGRFEAKGQLGCNLYRLPP